MLNFDTLWIEKYRPKTLADLCLEQETKNLITSYTNQQEIPNLLLVGRPGIGKTSLARIIINDLLKCQYMYINASDENGIDMVRNRIISFAQTKSLDGGIKVIILDEADGLTDVGQRALRNTMEEYAKYTRFILTANQLHRIIPALQSRCQMLQIEHSLLDVTVRCLHILKAEEIAITDEQRQSVIQLVKSHHPDIRRIINQLQKLSATGELILDQHRSSKFSNELLLKLTSKSSGQQIRQFVIENEDEFSNDYPSLLKDLLNAVYESSLAERQKQIIICIIAEHLYRCSFSMDQEINMFHCCLNILSNIT